MCLCFRFFFMYLFYCFSEFKVLSKNLQLCDQKFCHQKWGKAMFSDGLFPFCRKTQSVNLNWVLQQHDFNEGQSYQYVKWFVHRWQHSMEMTQELYVHPMTNQSKDWISYRMPSPAQNSPQERTSSQPLTQRARKYLTMQVICAINIKKDAGT